MTSELPFITIVIFEKDIVTKIGGLRTAAMEDWDLVENFKAIFFWGGMYLNLFRALNFFLFSQGFRGG